MTFKIDTSLATTLIADQFPQWADMPVVEVSPQGWDNRSFRLGRDMLLRLPSAARYAAQTAKEQHWLPILAPSLPLTIPKPLAMGQANAAYPWAWSVYTWIDGETARPATANNTRFASDLAQFLQALHRIDPSQGPAPGAHNFLRGGALATYDAETRAALHALAGRINQKAALAVWDQALASNWQAPPLWLHGDMAFNNLLVKAGALTAVIDFGSCGVGDPACDLVPAWTMFYGKARAAFCTALPFDKDTWNRARGWALWKAAITLADPLVDMAKAFRVLNDILANDIEPNR